MYIFDQNKKELLTSILILDSIDKGASYISNLQRPEIQKLKPIFDRMIIGDLLYINDEHIYFITKRGYELLDNFYDRYNEFIKFYDIFCAVDLTRGEFAFEKIFDMSDDEFGFYITDPRWEDLRVAVCQFKKIDPLQMIFISFFKEGRIDVFQPGWVDVLENCWDEILNIANSAISMETLMVDDQIKNITERGSILLKNLLEQEQFINEDSEIITTTTTTTTVEENVVDDDYVYDPLVYYTPYYYDPFYISPCWNYYCDTPYWW